MSDENDNQNKPLDINGRDENILPFTKQSPLDEPNLTRGEKIAQKAILIKKIRDISEGEWLLTQEILQEVEANALAKNPESKLTTTKAIEFLKSEIEARYKDDPDLKQLLLDGIPIPTRVSVWRKEDGWQEAVWSKLRTGNMFNNENRFKVMNSMYKKAIDGDVQAAKIWLTLSGDYADRMDVHTDKRLDAYREINEILHKKKE